VKTPPATTNKLSAAIAEALKLPDVAKRLADLSAEPGGNSPAEMAVFMKEEAERRNTRASRKAIGFRI